MCRPNSYLKLKIEVRIPKKIRKLELKHLVKFIRTFSHPDPDLLRTSFDKIRTNPERDGLSLSVKYLNYFRVVNLIPKIIGIQIIWGF